jgi:hypothetical protein
MRSQQRMLGEENMPDRALATATVSTLEQMPLRRRDGRHWVRFGEIISSAGL